MSTKASNSKSNPRRVRVTMSSWGVSGSGKVVVTPPHDATPKATKKRRKAG